MGVWRGWEPCVSVAHVRNFGGPEQHVLRRTHLKPRVEAIDVVAILVAARKHEGLAKDVRGAVVIPQLDVYLPLPVHLAETSPVVEICARAVRTGRALRRERDVLYQPGPHVTDVTARDGLLRPATACDSM